MSKERDQQVSLAEVDIQKHQSLIKKWLYLTHVSRWWGNPDDRWRQFLETPSGNHAVILFNEHPVGYLRWQKVIREELDSVGLQEIPDDAMDIDIFIGDQSIIGQNIGPDALSILLNRLQLQAGVSHAGIVTSVENKIAVRAFEKAGFEKLRQIDTNSFGRCWVLLADVSS